MKKSTHLRIARPTEQLQSVVDFYVDVLGFVEIGRFENHEGFDGVMLGQEDAGYHLEFTQFQSAENLQRSESHVSLQPPSPEHLLVFYFPDHGEWVRAIQRIEENGGVAVLSFNPYWDRVGKTFEDPDGYRIVIQNSRWPNQID